ncbi:MAG: hypothetical protein ACKV22_29475, partial [Bryobacteraceae bacterium]
MPALFTTPDGPHHQRPDRKGGLGLPALFTTPDGPHHQRPDRKGGLGLPAPFTTPDGPHHQSPDRKGGLALALDSRTRSETGGSSWLFQVVPIDPPLWGQPRRKG